MRSARSRARDSEHCPDHVQRWRGDPSTSSNTTTITVAEILDVTVTLNTATVSVTPGATQQELVFTVTNTGNGTETFRSRDSRRSQAINSIRRTDNSFHLFRYRRQWRFFGAATRLMCQHERSSAHLHRRGRERFASSSSTTFQAVSRRWRSRSQPAQRERAHRHRSAWNACQRVARGRRPGCGRRHDRRCRANLWRILGRGAADLCREIANGR